VVVLSRISKVDLFVTIVRVQFAHLSSIVICHVPHDGIFLHYLHHITHEVPVSFLSNGELGESWEFFFSQIRNQLGLQVQRWLRLPMHMLNSRSVSYGCTYRLCGLFAHRTILHRYMPGVMAWHSMAHPRAAAAVQTLVSLSIYLSFHSLP
jgi:hypothetical protein